MKISKLACGIVAALTCAAAPVTASAAGGGGGNLHVKIDLSQQQAYLYSGNQVVASGPVSTGREGHRTPAGHYRVQAKERFHRSTLYGDFVGPGGHVVRRNVASKRDRAPSGAHFQGAAMPYYLRFTRGIGMHAGHLPGRPASHGCVRLNPGMARMLYENASVGTPVTVVR